METDSEEQCTVVSCRSCATCGQLNWYLFFLLDRIPSRLSVAVSFTFSRSVRCVRVCVDCTVCVGGCLCMAEDLISTASYYAELYLSFCVWVCELSCLCYL